MEKIYILFFCLVMISSAQNLLQNPGFESWSGGMPDNWNKDDSIGIFQEDVIVHSGNFSAKDSLFTQTQSTADLFQGWFAVQANTQYDFTVWVYDNDPAGRVRHGIQWFPSGSSWSPVYSLDSTGWQELTISATSPSGTDSALVLIRAYDISGQWDGEAIFYIDDAYFAAPSTQPPVINRIWHTPINPGSGIAVDVYAEVHDNGTIDADTLYYGINNLDNPIKLSHITVVNDTFRFQIPGQTVDDTIFYYAKFIDDEGLEAISDTHAYYVGEIDIYINEVYYDGPGSDSGCFVEIFGPGSADLDGFSIVGVNGLNGIGYVTIDLSGSSIPTDGFFVIAQDSSVPNYDFITPDANLQNGPDNAELRYYNITIDALGYGTLNGWYFTGEWLPASDVALGHSLGRYPDGDDTDNNFNDFHDYTTPTPGRPNPEVGINERCTATIDMPSITNPIASGIAFSSLINNTDYYPLIVYNALGQVVDEISKPDARLSLSGGVYFLKLTSIEKVCLKVVVVK